MGINRGDYTGSRTIRALEPKDLKEFDIKVDEEAILMKSLECSISSLPSLPSPSDLRIPPKIGFPVIAEIKNNVSLPCDVVFSTRSKSQAVVFELGKAAVKRRFKWRRLRFEREKVQTSSDRHIETFIPPHKDVRIILDALYRPHLAFLERNAVLEFHVKGVYPNNWVFRTHPMSIEIPIRPAERNWVEMTSVTAFPEVTCSYCAHGNPNNAEFCIKCGRHLGRIYI